MKLREKVCVCVCVCVCVREREREKDCVRLQLKGAKVFKLPRTENGSFLS